MKKGFSVFAAATAMALCAVAAPKADPVAEGYPVWQGITPKSHVLGREITPSDLRHRVTVVIEIEPGAALKSQLLKAGGLVQWTGLAGLGHGANWETMELPRDVIVLVSNRGNKDPEAINAALKASGQDETALTYYRSTMVPFYDNVTFEGGPETEGKRPYIYVMGPTGVEPLAQGRLDDAGIKSAKAAIKKGKSMISEGGATWRKFYGTADPTHFPALAKALEGGKPLKAVAAAIQKDIASKDAERARESQIVYDALEQARNDLLLRIRLEARECPHRAYYDFQQLVKYWPSEKKKVDDLMNKLKAIPDGEKLAKMFCKAMAWSEPDFMCKNKGEANKIVKELTKMKGNLEKMKESKVIVIQNGALLLDSQIDTLIATIPDKVAGK